MDRVSKPIMTKYEFNSLIALRTMHLSNMGIPFITLPEGFKIESNMDLRKIAIMELKEGKLPYLIKRTLPTKKVEYWKIKEMDFSAVKNLIRD
jgi:DNA-directed RNA polymerase subunit K/omega